jgi:predicted protein tyrosine phosphatase
MKKFLFICGKNQHRSPTAENIFSENEELEVRSAGVDNDAIYQVSTEDIEWAEYVFVMEEKHREKLRSLFKDSIKDQRIISLDIQDKYRYMDEELVLELRNKVAKFLN